MKNLMITDFHAIKINDKYYFSFAFYSIYKRYYDKFGKFTIITRVCKKEDITNDLNEVTDMCKIIDYKSFGEILKPRVPKEIINAIKEADFIVLRQPSFFSDKLYKYIKKWNKTYLTEVMECTWDALYNHGLLGKIIAPYSFFKMKQIVRNANFCTYVTEKFLQKRYPCKNRSIGVSNVYINDINKSRKYKKIDCENIFLCTTAGLDVKYKGQQYVIKAIKELKNKGINCIYYLAGSGTGENLKKFAKKYDIEANIKILGMLEHNDVLKLMNNCDIYIQPSLQEGLPRSVIEALSQGTICIGTKIAGIPELLDDKFLFGKKDYRAIAKLIENISNMTVESLNKISVNNVNFSKDYLNEILNKKREEYYEFIKKNIND